MSEIKNLVNIQVSLIHKSNAIILIYSISIKVRSLLLDLWSFLQLRRTINSKIEGFV